VIGEEADVRKRVAVDHEQVERAPGVIEPMSERPHARVEPLVAATIPSMTESPA